MGWRVQTHRLVQRSHGCVGALTAHSLPSQPTLCFAPQAFMLFPRYVVCVINSHVAYPAPSSSPCVQACTASSGLTGLRTWTTLLWCVRLTLGVQCHCAVMCEPDVWCLLPTLDSLLPASPYPLHPAPFLEYGNLCFAGHNSEELSPRLWSSHGAPMLALLPPCSSLSLLCPSRGHTPWLGLEPVLLSSPP